MGQHYGHVLRTIICFRRRYVAFAPVPLRDNIVSPPTVLAKRVLPPAVSRLPLAS